MERDWKRGILVVLLGFSLLLILLTWFGLLFNVIYGDDLLKIAEDEGVAVAKSLNYIKWTSLGLVVLLAIFFLFACTRFFSAGARLRIGAAVLCLILITALSFLLVYPIGFAHYEEDKISEIALSALTAYQSQLAQGLVAMLFLGAGCAVDLRLLIGQRHSVAAAVMCGEVENSRGRQE